MNHTKSLWACLSRGVHLFFLLAAFQSSADEIENFVQEEIIRLYRQRISVLERLSSLSQANRQDILELRLDLQVRRDELFRQRSMGMGYNENFLRFVTDEAILRTQVLLAKWKLDSAIQEDFAAKHVAALDRKVSLAEFRLRHTYSKIVTIHPRLYEILSLMAFSRSETLSDGTIGEWNPADPRSIQSSSSEGLKKVLLSFMETVRLRTKLDVDQLVKYHLQLLGAAGHFYSRGGQINDIVFVGENGQQTTARDVLAEWEKSIQNSRPDLRIAQQSYDTLIHVHGFGDANGRIAEIAKQHVLAIAYLPPLLTREKTAVENYQYQKRFGTGFFQEGLYRQTLETQGFIEEISRLIPASETIGEVQLAGSSVVIATLKDDKPANLHVITRMYEHREGQLPPIKGVPVISDAKLGDLQLRLTTNNWENYQDLAPTKLITTERQGRTKLAYGVFSLPMSGSSFSTIALSFAFHYRQSNGLEVWFNNRQANYNVALKLSTDPCNQLSSANFATAVGY
jgi:hypothetical protein